MSVVAARSRCAWRLDFNIYWIVNGDEVRIVGKVGQGV